MTMILFILTLKNAGELGCVIESVAIGIWEWALECEGSCCHTSLIRMYSIEVMVPF
jgi:hypothetical protein